MNPEIAILRGQLTLNIGDTPAVNVAAWLGRAAAQALDAA